MSRVTLPRKTGLILAVVAFALGLTAATALGWETEQNNDRNHGKEWQSEDRDHDKGGKTHDKGQENEGRDHDKGENKGRDQGKGKDHGKEEGGKPVQPNVTVPAPQPVAPTVTPAPAPSAVPVTPQGAPTPPSGGNGEENGEEGGGPTLAQEGAPEGPALAPAAERQELAKTGLDPALMALLGVFCLAGGAFLFKRAFAR